MTQNLLRSTQYEYADCYRIILLIQIKRKLKNILFRINYIISRMLQNNQLAHHLLAMLLYLQH